MEKLIFPGCDLTDTPGNAILFECGNPFIAEMISNCNGMTSICYRAGETTLAVREEGLTKFSKQVRLLGLGVR